MTSKEISKALDYLLYHDNYNHCNENKMVFDNVNVIKNSIVHENFLTIVAKYTQSYSGKETLCNLNQNWVNFRILNGHNSIAF